MSDTFDPNKGQNNSCSINKKGDQYVECTECGAQAEIGTVIQVGDDVFKGSVESDDKDKTQDIYNKCLTLAKSISDELSVNKETENDGKKINYLFKFSCTVEKMIYEMKVRSII